MDFNDYVNQLNNLDNQEIKAELENFYFFNSGLLQFFKAIDNQVKMILSRPNLNAKSVELIQNQVNEVLPTLNKLKLEISMFDSNKLSEEYKETINKTITYVKNLMVTGEVDIISNQFFDLLKRNETTFISEQEARKCQGEKEEVERNAKVEQERREREEANLRKQVEEEYEKLIGIAILLDKNISSDFVKKYFQKTKIERRNNQLYEIYFCYSGIITLCVEGEEIETIRIERNSEIKKTEYNKIDKHVTIPYSIRLNDSYNDIVDKIGKSCDIKKPWGKGYVVEINDYIWNNLGSGNKFNLRVSIAEDDGAFDIDISRDNFE